jgi:thiosulfate/3-mercaptopyruvate sulfurtransferase
VKQEARMAIEELHERLADPGLVVVDTRPLHAYNGWCIDGATRGGHIPGAIAFPGEWEPLLDDADLGDVLVTKGVTTDREVVLYGDGAPSLHARLASLGYSVRTLENWATWIADAVLPLEQLPLYRRLVHVDWLRTLLAGGRPEAAPAGRALLFHVNFGVPEEYEESHLPGALYLDTNWLENPVDWNRRTPDELEEALQRLGMTDDTTVVLYGRDTEGRANEKWPGRRAGQIAAARAALILTYAGVEDVRILDGGYDRWVQAGNELETTVREPSPVPSFGASVPVRPEVIIDLEAAKEILADRDGAALVSVRTWREHIGETSGYNYIEAAGRIAGDVWGNCGSDAYHMQHYRNVDNTMRAYPEIAANWVEAGITSDKWVAFYCGTGWRASETWFYALLMGWQNVAVYDGGWFEWSQDPLANPIEIGLEEGVVI